jgi:hypothetical protein
MMASASTFLLTGRHAHVLLSHVMGDLGLRATGIMVAILLGIGSRLRALGKSRPRGEGGDGSDGEHLCQVHDFLLLATTIATLGLKIKAKSNLCQLIHVKSAFC